MRVFLLTMGLSLSSFLAADPGSIKCQSLNLILSSLEQHYLPPASQSETHKFDRVSGCSQDSECSLQSVASNNCSSYLKNNLAVSMHHQYLQNQEVQRLKKEHLRNCAEYTPIAFCQPASRAECRQNLCQVAE